MKWSTCVLFAISVLCNVPATAQTQPSSENVNNRVIPAPPNVASFLKVANVPISTYTGGASVSIPLYTIQTGDLKIPITMSYSSNGLKVTEEASWIGFGWNLNVGGVIHQNVVGLPDDYLAPDEGYWPMPKDMPVNSNTNIFELNRLQKRCTFMDTLYNPRVFNVGIISKGNNHEFDQYLYNFGAYSGKFIMPNYPYNSGIAKLDRNNIQISCLFGNSFKATTPDGTQYIFTTIGKTVTPQSTCSLPTPTLTSYSYYLTKIISPDGNIATFVYKKYVSNTLASLSQSYGYNSVGGSGAYLQSQGFVTNIVFAEASGGNSISDISTFSTSQVENLVIDSIKTANTIVKFNTSPRDDVDQGVKLDNIAVYRIGEATSFKGFNFSYDYFVGDNSYGDWMTDPAVVLGCGGTGMFYTVPGVNIRSERLKLNSVQFTGYNGVSAPPYEFIYDSSPIPYKTSMSQDLWGYFNGSASHSLLPNYNDLGYFDSHVPSNLLTITNKAFGLRKTVPQYLQAGILRKVINPTGGYTKITYEPNQFVNLPMSSSKIKDTLLSVTDVGAGRQQLEFDVPDIGYSTINPPNINPASYNPVLINVLLIKGNNTGCTISSGYNAYNSYASPQNNSEALYGLLEKWDPVNNIWTISQDNIYDANNSSINSAGGGAPCQGSNISKLLVPGHYRITANFPDSQPGYLPSPSASITITYKYTSTQQYPNYAGGLRVKSIADYTDINHMYNQKIYTYYSGKLMTRPIFYRNYLSLDNELRAQILPNEGCTSAIDIGLAAPPDAFGISTSELPITSLLLFSSPVLNYSYSATGAVVGYDSVKVDYSTGKDIGETVYKYRNIPDTTYYYPGILPGIQGASNLLNGTLISTTQLKKNTNGSLSPIQIETDGYVVTNFQDYWAYKSDYVPPVYLYNSGAIVPGNGLDLTFNFLHFYPVKAGNVHISNKIETYFDAPQPYTVSTIYQYNTANQVSNVSVTKSDGRSAVKQTYYPSDYTASSGFTAQMRAKNMIDYPIEEIGYIDNLSGTNSASYTEYYQHDGTIISPLNLYNLKSVLPVNLTPSVPANNRDSHYTLGETFGYDAFGNLVKDQRANGPTTNFLWDYRHFYPIAKISNTANGDFAYTSFEADGKGQWAYTGTPIIDATCPSGNYSYSIPSGTLSSPTLIANKTYILSYWTTNAIPYSINGTVSGYPVKGRTLTGWTNFKHKVTGVTGLSIGGSGNVDEIRLFPVDAQMSSYTYEPLIGSSSSTDASGKISYYEYDPLQNLLNIKDNNENIQRSYQYHYQGGSTAIANQQISQVFTTNNCQPGYGGGPVTYTVPAGTYVSYISQQAANDLAQDDINDNGQNYANVHGGAGCVVIPCTASQITVTKTGATTYSMTYTSTGGANSTVLIITNTSTGASPGPPPATTSAGGTVTGTAPASATYAFKLMAFGPNCPGGVTSNTVTLTF